MSKKKNKVRFGLKNCYYAKATFDEDGNVTYGKPVRLPGAVSIGLDPEGESENFYADDIVYVVLNNNAGYEGDLELALIPEEFLKDILHEEEDANGVLLENADNTFERFALLFEFTGDQKAIRHVFYCCSASRPSAEGDTKEDEKDVQTEELSIIASALTNGYVKAKTGENTSKAVYDAWYDEVYMPPASEEPEDESGENDGEDQPAG
jgi:phi13 family phage major tail protein